MSNVWRLVEETRSVVWVVLANLATLSWAVLLGDVTQQSTPPPLREVRLRLPFLLKKERKTDSRHNATQSDTETP